MTDMEHKAKKAAELAAGNERSYAELQAETHALGGRYSMDTGDLRRELFIESLVKWGIISEDQKLDYDLEFHAQVETALNEAWEQVREAKKQRGQRHLVVAKKPEGLVDQHGRPLGG